MDLGLQGKHAIVTGGSRGIGKAIARELAREGVDVAIVARNKGDLEATAGAGCRDEPAHRSPRSRSSEVLLRKPTTGIAFCCAPAKSGYAAALARTVMKFRRLIPSPSIRHWASP
jgi:NAD(P)-dependent dehydrogenase (short-subunit alcohol dehydrogenase family)